MRRRPLLMQLLIGMSISRYLPAIGTAGLLRYWVRGYSRLPRPPPRINVRTSSMADPFGSRPRENQRSRPAGRLHRVVNGLYDDGAVPDHERVSPVLDLGRRAAGRP